MKPLRSPKRISLFSTFPTIWSLSSLNQLSSLPSLTSLQSRLPIKKINSRLTMKSFIKLCILLMAYFEVSSLGINIYHENQTEKAMFVYQSFISKGISERLISIINKRNPCSRTYEKSFVDICINNEKKMKVIRKTSWLHKSLKPLKNKQPRL